MPTHLQNYPIANCSKYNYVCENTVTLKRIYFQITEETTEERLIAMNGKWYFCIAEAYSWSGQLVQIFYTHILTFHSIWTFNFN